MNRFRTHATYGSTVIEVLMAIAVLSIGAAGILSLQKATSVANRDAKNLEVANEITRTWLERLRADSLKWNHPSPLDPNSDIDTDTVWLANHVAAAGTQAWIRPEDGTNQIVYGVHDAFGKDDLSGNQKGPYCVNIRLTWLRPDQSLLRAEVRVYWLRNNISMGAADLSMQPPEDLCGDGSSANVPDVTAANDVFHFVYATTAIAKNLAY